MSDGNIDTVETKKLLQEQNELIKKMRDQLEAGEKLGKNMQKESTESIEKLNARLDEIELKLARPKLGLDVQPSDKDAREQKRMDIYQHWLRKGEKDLSDLELKALAADTDNQGGYLIPAMRAKTMIKKLIEFSPIRELASVISISAGDVYEEPSEGATDFAAAWVGERGTRGETTAAKIGLERVPVHEMYANPFVTQKMLDDTEFQLEAWLNDRLSMRFAVLEGTAFVSGTGVNQPEGILSNANIATVNSGSSGAVTGDGLISLLYDLPEYYVRNATFVMKRSLLGAIRKLKDSQNQYLWQPGLAGGQPATILDRPYREAIDMPVAAAASKSVAVGDFARGYRIVDRVDVRQVRDPYTNKPYVSFYTTRRVGGQVVLPEAFRIQVLS